MVEPKKSEEKFYSKDYLLFHNPVAQEAARRAWRERNMFMFRHVFEREGINIDGIMESVIQDCL